MTDPHATGSDDADRAAIVRLTARYCWALDTRDWDRLADVFTPDAVAELGMVCRGLPAITERVRDALEPLAASQHTVSTHDVDVDGDRAWSRCALVAQHVGRGADEAKFLVGGSYHDELVRTDDGWRISSRRLEVTWTDGDAALLDR